MEREGRFEYFSFPEFEKIEPFVIPTKLRKDGEEFGKDYILLYRRYTDCALGVRAKGKKVEREISPVLTLLADLVYFALHHAELGEKMWRFGDEMVHLIVQSTPTDALLWAMKTSVHLIGGEAGSVTIYDRKRNKMMFPYFYRMPAELTKFEIDFGKGLSSDIVRSRKGIIVEDYAKYPNKLSTFVKAGVKSIIGAPVIYADTVFGAIGVFALKCKRKFTEGDLLLLETIGRVCGALLHRISIESDVTVEAKDYINKMMFYEGLVNLLSVEMNTPVRTIFGLSSFLKEEMKDPLLRKYVELIHSSASKLETTSNCLYECLRVMSVWEPLTPVDTGEIFETTARMIEKMYPFVVVRRPSRKFPTVLTRMVHTKFIFSQVLRLIARAMEYKGEIKVKVESRKNKEIFTFLGRGVPLERNEVELFIVQKCVEAYGGGISWKSKKGINEISFSLPSVQ